MTRFDEPHINISDLGQARPYKSKGVPIRNRIQRIRTEHGPRLIEEYETAFEEAIRDRPTDQEKGIKPNGVVLEFELVPSLKSASLERVREQTRQGAVRIDANSTKKVALIVPDEKRNVWAKLLDEYTNAELENEDENPPNASRIDPIEHIRRAKFETFWRDDPNALPDSRQTDVWWGVWCFNDAVDGVVAAATRLKGRVSESNNYLHFPDVTVVPIYSTQIVIEFLLFGTLGIAEVRRASDSPTFFMTEIHGDEHVWINEYAERVIWPPNDAPTVCLLDTGVNRGHPLIEPALAINHLDTVVQPWNVNDHNGHNTGMAGIALHGDLTALLGDTAERRLNHRAEAVKILPPNEFNRNEPNAYGPITQSAVSIAEINNSDAPFRSFCMAVTNHDRTGAEATSWSVAIDQAAAGAMAGDGDDDPKRRLFVLAVGNIGDHEAKDALEKPDAFPAEDPSQAWNALTFGGFTDKTEIHDAGYDGYSSWSDPGQLSPYSRSSFL